MDLTTPFGGAGINANVGPPASGNNLLTTAVIGLGITSLANTVATVVIPFLTGNKTTARSMRNLFPQTTHYTLENAVVENLLKAKDKYIPLNQTKQTKLKHDDTIVSNLNS